MASFSEQHLRTGGDPRTLSEFTALRDELNKLTHPARPDVDWQKVEQLCLGLFRQNGVELQTTAYYTLARAHRAGLAGIEEGLVLVDGLLTHQWPVFWPAQTHARMEILGWLATRLQQLLRGYVFKYGDLPIIYRTETLLEHLGEVLARLELKHLSQLDGLYHLMHNTALRLESLDGDNAIQGGSTLAARPSMSIAGPEMQDDSPLVYVVQAEAKPVIMRVENTASGIQKSLWVGFAAGLICMALVGSAGLWGWNAWHQEPVRNVLLATVEPLPQPLSPAQMNTLRTEKADKLPTLTNEMVAATQKQLENINSLPALWSLNYASQLVKQAQTLWPQTPAVDQLAAGWLLNLNAQAAASDTLGDWHMAQSRLQLLANKLNGLDEQRGKYMTVSELKSSIFAIQQPLVKSPPLEELLRQLSEQQNAGKVSPALVRQIDNRFKQLQSRYMLLMMEPRSL